jgi:hypothetical protein
MSNKKNWFGTLNEALESEGLLDTWPVKSGLVYGEHFSYTYEDGSKYGHYVSVYRSEDGLYERPVHYRR